MEAYGWRSKIEVSFRALVERVFAFCYRFWMKAMARSKRGYGDQSPHRTGKRYILEKILATRAKATLPPHPLKLAA